jgi:excisionase family DNA binding protein
MKGERPKASKHLEENKVFSGNKRLYTLKEASAYLGRSVWGVRELIWAGKIPVVRDGRKIFIDILDLEKFVESNKSTFI